MQPLRLSLMLILLLLACLSVVHAQEATPEPSADPPSATVSDRNVSAPSPSAASAPAEPVGKEDRVDPSDDSPHEDNALESTIEKALANNPAIQQAQAQLREAEAKLRQVQMEVSQEVSDVFGQLERQRKQLENLRASLKENETLAQSGRLTGDVLRSVKSNVEMTQMSVASLEAKLRALSGMMPRMTSLSTLDPVASAPEEPLVRIERPKLATTDTKMSIALQTPNSVEFENTPMPEVIEYLVDSCGIGIMFDESVADVQIKYIRLNDVALEDILEAVARSSKSMCFVVRKNFLYGTTRENAKLINAPTIPDDVPLYVGDWDAKNSEKKSQKYFYTPTQPEKPVQKVVPPQPKQKVVPPQ